MRNLPEQDIERAIKSHAGDLITKLGDLWLVKNLEINRFISKQMTKTQKCSLHSEISCSFEIKLNKDLTLFEEQMYHVYMSRNHSELKQKLADIEHFILLYTPVLKIDLFKYWQFLESAGYEPVSEYARSLDAFEVKLNPSSINLFKIILQFCRFFKEYADFETEKTPEFKHPFIINKLERRGEEDSRRHITGGNGLIKEVSTKRRDFLKDFRDISISDVGQTEEQFKDQDESLISLDSFEGEDLLRDEEEYDDRGRRLIDYLQSIGISDELKKLNIMKNPTGRSQVPNKVYDVKVPNQMEKFIQIHKNEADEVKRMKRDYLKNLDRDNIHLSDDTFLSIGEDSQPNFDSPPLENSFERETSRPTDSISNNILIHKQEHNYEDYIFPTEKRKKSYFHYKRWIWIMFPWACITSIRSLPFSYLISRCFEAPTKYLSVLEEKVISRSALKIARDYKMTVNVIMKEEEEKKKKIERELVIRFGEKKITKPEVVTSRKSSARQRSTQNRRYKAGDAVMEDFRNEDSALYKIVKAHRIANTEESSNGVLSTEASNFKRGSKMKSRPTVMAHSHSNINHNLSLKLYPTLPDPSKIIDERFVSKNPINPSLEARPRTKTAKTSRQERLGNSNIHSVAVQEKLKTGSSLVFEFNKTADYSLKATQFHRIAMETTRVK